MKYRVRIRSRHPSHKVLRKNPRLLFKDKVVYRLGSTTQTDIPQEINSVEGIKTSSNKWLMKTAFKEAGINTTEFYAINALPEEIPFPILAKKKFGSKGRGMIKIDNQEELNEFLAGDTNGYYFEKYFNGSREYRLHVSPLGCFYSCRKMRKRDAEQRWFFNSLNCVWITEKTKIVNNSNEFVSFSDEDNPEFNKPKTWDQIIEHCQRAIAAVGLDVGAVDLRVNKKGEFVVLETNSAPSFGDITSEMYLTHLPKLLKYKFSN